MTWKKRAAFYLSFLLVKAAWIPLYRISGQELLSGSALPDFMARRAFLMDRVVGEFQNPEQQHKRLPDLFQGEWALGTFSMTAIALTNIAFLDPSTQSDARNAVGLLVERMRQPAVSRFDTDQWKEEALETLDKNRGHIAYLGQLNLALAAWHFLGGDARYRLLFERVSEAIQRRVEASPFLNAETYPGEIYPMDNVAALASLELYERWVYQRPSSTVQRWVAYGKTHLRDKRTGLLVHSLDEQGRPTQGARGCSTAWYSFFLPMMDPVFARDQYDLMRQSMVDRVLGLTGVREYPKGISGHGDVDSGPVIFGLSTSATGFALGGARWQHDVDFLDRLGTISELVGFTIQWKGRRRYLTAPLVGDAIMLAMRTMTPWDRRFKERV